MFQVKVSSQEADPMPDKIKLKSKRGHIQRSDKFSEILSPQSYQISYKQSTMSPTNTPPVMTRSPHSPLSISAQHQNKTLYITDTHNDQLSRFNMSDIQSDQPFRPFSFEQFNFDRVTPGTTTQISDIEMKRREEKLRIDRKRRRKGLLRKSLQAIKYVL